jgi:3-oxoacyl-(acyl-carrier-protein) synthase
MRRLAHLLRRWALWLKAASSGWEGREMQAAITGLGMVLPTGIGLQALWQHWDAQSPALRPYRSERIDSERIGYFGAVAPQDHAAAREAVPHKLRRYGTPTTHLGVLAATQALRHGGIAEVEADNDRWALATTPAPRSQRSSARCRRGRATPPVASTCGSSPRRR